MDRHTDRRTVRAMAWRELLLPPEIYYWLSNEKYVGDTLCQKTYKTGFPFVQKIKSLILS